MVRPPATSPFALVFAATAALSAGCFDTSSSLTTLDYPTLLTVDPLHFRGSLACGEPGLARYVVSIFNATEPNTSCMVPPCADSTSLPIPCQQKVSFGEPPLKPAHYYTSIIEGYNRGDLQQATPGSRDMFDPSSGEIIPPTWTTTCGELPPTRLDPDAESDAEADASTDVPYNPLRFPTRVIPEQEVILHGCRVFTDAGKPDASIDDGSTPPDDVSGDSELPDVSQDAVDATAPDAGGPEPEDAAEGGDEDGSGDGDGTSDDGEGGDGASDDGGTSNSGGRRRKRGVAW